MVISNVLVLSPYAGLEHIFTQMAKDFPNLSISFYRKSPAALKIELEKETIRPDVVICTEKYAGEEYMGNVPALPMKLTFSDMLYALKSTENRLGKRALVCYALTGKEQLKSYAASIGELLRRPIPVFDTDDPEEIEPLLHRLQQEKYSVIIGGDTTVRLAKSIGLNAVQIPYGQESVRNCLERASVFCNATCKAQEAQSIYRKLLNEISDYIMVIDQDENMIYHNGEKNPVEFNRLLKEYRSLDIDSRFNEVEFETKDVVWGATAKRSKLIGEQYTVLCFDRRRFVDPTVGGAITFMGSAPASIILDIYRSTNFAHIKEMIETYQHTKRSVLISGERGMGKENVAFLLNNEEPLLRIDCNHLTLDDFQAFKKEGFQRLYESDIGTVLLANVDTVRPELQDMLADFLIQIQGEGKIRFISTAWDEIYRKVSRGQYNDRLYHIVSEICIDIPPLDDMIQSMDEEISYIISGLNIELGLQVVGITDEALSLLKQFEWNSNLQQLVDVLKRSMLTSRSSYLSGDVVQRVISMEKNLWGNNRGAAAFWVGSLEEIEGRIIRGILEEEGMNQAKAAKRLKISRSTLRRKIQ